MDAHRGDFQLSVHRAPVQRLDVFELMHELETLRIDLVVRQRVEHERVVRVGTVPDAKGTAGSGGGGHAWGPSVRRSVWSWTIPDPSVIVVKGRACVQEQRNE